MICDEQSTARATDASVACELLHESERREDDILGTPRSDAPVVTAPMLVAQRGKQLVGEVLAPSRLRFDGAGRCVPACESAIPAGRHDRPV